MPFSLTLTVNGTPHTRTIDPRLLLSDFLREELGLTGTHVGCAHGSCGACTVLMRRGESEQERAAESGAAAQSEFESVRSCIIFAVQANGHEITTIEGLTPDASGDHLHPIQQALWETHGLQCGYCTPGFVLTLIPFLQENPNPSEQDVREAISGNLCRCTGYQNIVDAAMLSANRLRELEPGQSK